MSCSSQSPLARRSGSRAGGRRCRAPSRPCRSCFRRVGLGVHHHARRDRRGAGGRRAARGPRSRPGTGGRSRRPRACRWRRASGSAMPASIAARMIEVPSGTVTVTPSMVSVTVFVGLGGRRAVVDFAGSATWCVSSFGSARARGSARRNLRGNGQRAHHRIGREAAERAERAELHRVAEVVAAARGSPRGRSPAMMLVDRLDAARRADAAGRALAAAFDRRRTPWRSAPAAPCRRCRRTPRCRRGRSARRCAANAS